MALLTLTNETKSVLVRARSRDTEDKDISELEQRD